VVERFTSRAIARDPALEQDLFELYTQNSKVESVAQFMLDPASFKSQAVDQTR